MNRKAVSNLKLTVILVIAVGIILAVQQISFIGWDNVQAKAKSLLGLLGLSSKSGDQPAVQIKNCIHSKQYDVWYSSTQFINNFDKLVRQCISNCSASNDFSPCRKDPPDPCCYSSSAGPFCTPNCCYTRCRERCDEPAVLASSDICQPEEAVNDRGKE